jgi:hypothetical protein
MTDLPPVLRTYISGLKAHDVERVASAVSDDLAFVSSGRTLNKSQFLDMLRVSAGLDAVVAGCLYRWPRPCGCRLAAEAYRRRSRLLRKRAAEEGGFVADRCRRSSIIAVPHGSVRAGHHHKPRGAFRIGEANHWRGALGATACRRVGVGAVGGFVSRPSADRPTSHHLGVEGPLWWLAGLWTRLKICTRPIRSSSASTWRRIPCCRSGNRGGSSP